MVRAQLTTSKHAQAGFSVVEVLLAATVFGMLVTGLIGAIVYGRNTTADAGTHQRGMLYAEEGIAAARNISNSAYSNLVDGTYGLVQSGNQWAFSGTSDTQDIFTRVVTIATAGTNRKLVTSTVTWPQSATSSGGSIALTTRLTNWEANIKLWSNAVVAGSADATGTNDAIKIDTVGNYAYFVENISGAANFFIANISNPAAPTIAGSLTLAGTPTNIAVSGNYAYITNQQDTGEMQVVDITNPAAPVYKTLFDMVGTGNGQSIAVSGNYAYVARASDTTTNANEFTVVNITNPLVPTLAGGYNNNISMNGMYLNGNYAYVPTSSTTTEMLVVSIITPTAPALAASYNAPTSVAANTIAGYGNYVFLGDGTTLQPVNITVPTTPTTVAVTFTAAGAINKIEIDATQTYAYLGTSGTAAEVQVINVATPAAAISLAKTIDISGTTSTVNGLAYNSTYDTVAVASASNTQELLVVSRN